MKKAEHQPIPFNFNSSTITIVESEARPVKILLHQKTNLFTTKYLISKLTQTRKYSLKEATNNHPIKKIIRLTN